MIIESFDIKYEEEVLNIWREAALTAHYFIEEKKQIEDMNYVWKKYLPELKTYVAIEDSEICGFISMIDDTIAGLFVAPKWQRKSVGKLLVEHVKREDSALTVEVFHKNINAIKFYESVGFTKFSEYVHCDFNELIWVMKMTKYEKAMKLMDDLCGNEKEEIIAIATISLSPGETGNPRPSVRMVCAYYENGAFYVSTDAKKNKMLEIEKNNEVSVCGMGWYTFQGKAENLGWVKDEKNSEIRAKFKKVFDWFDEVGDEENPDSIVLRITLTEGTIIDHEKKYGEDKYEIDFVNRTAR